MVLSALANAAIVGSAQNNGIIVDQNVAIARLDELQGILRRYNVEISGCLFVEIRDEDGQKINDVTFDFRGKNGSEQRKTSRVGRSD